MMGYDEEDLIVQPMKIVLSENKKNWREAIMMGYDEEGWLINTPPQHKKYTRGYTF